MSRAMPADASMQRTLMVRVGSRIVSSRTRVGDRVLVIPAARHKISPLRRMLCIPITVLCALAGLAPFIDGASLQTPVFEPIRLLAPFWVWGVAWLVAAVAGVIGASRGSWAAYTIANVLVAGLSALWLGAVIYGRWWLGITLSLTAIGLWAFPLLVALASTVVHADVVEREKSC